MRSAFSVSPLLLLLSLTTYASAAETTDGKLYTQQPELAPAVGRPAVPAQALPAKPALLNEGPAPSWIWGADQNKKYVVRKSFSGPAKVARLRATCDNVMSLYVNGKTAGSSTEWQSPIEVDVQKHLQDGENVITA